MNIINQIAESFKATNIHEEVSMLREQAIERISHEDIASVILKDNLNYLNIIAVGTYKVLVPDKIDENYQPLLRDQAWNDMLWTITINTLVENDGLNGYMLGGIIHAWSIGSYKSDGKDVANSLVHLEAQHSTALAERYIAELQMMGCLNASPSQKHMLVDGELKSTMLFEVTEAYIEYVQEIRKELSKKKVMRFQPLQHQPIDWTDNFTGIGNDSNAKLIKGSSKKHVARSVLSAVNKLQRVQFKLHPDIHKLASLVVNNENKYRNMWSISVSDWKECIQGWRALVNLKVGRTYYFPVTMDFRGRMYYRGGLLTPQGAEFAKAVFVFNKELPLGAWGFGALCVSFANALGMSGSQVQKIQRVEEAVKNGKLSDMLKSFDNLCTVMPNAKHCQAWVLGLEVIKAERHRIEHGSYDTFKTGIPCHQDGTCNGLQHQAIITHCAITARATNMMSASFKDVPNDVYGLVVSNLTSAILRELGRELGKKPVMTGSYGASEGTIAKQMYAYMNAKGVLWQKEYKDDMINSMYASVPALLQVTNATKHIAEASMIQGKCELNWTTYDGFEVTQQYLDNDRNMIRGGSFNAVVNRHDPFLDTQKMITALSPNFIHSIDSTHIRCTVNAVTYDLACIHDSVASHACNFYATNKVLRMQMYELHTGHNHLGNLCESNNVDTPEFQGDYNIKESLDAVNMFG